ncbi:hypothetical protein [Hydromonas duriensis]|uniref:Uncharacterized protein n=1 Tax=Hydromonas duriensis TaxID=1527608 RepID=A0A4R6YB24_9BURK|nr:hypothetical protein [Hydromonas duriensis]TDR32811.1 hypothetical protein DFR44_102110 [Hydromonas duriensis]
MKKLLSTISLSLALLSPTLHAQQTPTEKLSLEQSILCMKANAPAKWDALVSWVDRSNPQQITVNALAHIAGTPIDKTVPFNVCDAETQAHALLGLTTLIPKNESMWKTLLVRIDDKGNYSVLTDISMARANK